MFFRNLKKRTRTEKEAENQRQSKIQKLSKDQISQLVIEKQDQLKSVLSSWLSSNVLEAKTVESCSVIIQNGMFENASALCPYCLKSICLSIDRNKNEIKGHNFHRHIKKVHVNSSSDSKEQRKITSFFQTTSNNNETSQEVEIAMSMSSSSAQSSKNF